MKPFAAFIKMQLNVNYGVSALKYRFTREKKKLWEPILIAVVIPLALLPMLVLYTLMMTGIFAASSAMQPAQPEVILTIAFLFTQLVILFFGIFYVMGTFYFSQDLEALITLPLKPYEVIGGKFAVVMINEYLTSMPILLPPLIIYGAGTGQGLQYWLKGFLLLLAAPALPLTIASLLVMLLMRVVNFRRYKDLMAIIGGLAAMVLAIGFNMFMQNIPKNGGANFADSFLSSNFDLIELVGKRYPPGIWATRALSENGFGGIGYLLLFLAVCILLFSILLWLSNQVFYRSLLAGQEVRRRKRTADAAQMDKQYGKAGSPVLAIVKREWKLLFRTPIYALNGLTGSVVGPIIVLILFFTNRQDEDSVMLFSMLGKPEAAPYVLLGGLGLMLFTAGMNVVASTSLSREGNTFWITKMIPVSPRQQVTAKLILSYLISAVGVLVTGLVLVLFLGQAPAPVLGISLVGLLGAVPMTALSLLLDIFHPKLIWNSEQEAMKQNMNGVLGMLLSLLVLLVLGLVAFMLMMLEVDLVIVLAAVGAVSVILGVLSILALYGMATGKYRELEA
jgi:ABC-2 type transport system permease protein